MPQVSVRNYVSIAPCGVGACQGGFSWPQSRESILAAEAAVMECITLAKSRYHIAENRIFIAGCGTGGTMAFRVGLNHAEQFAGVLSFAGAMPADQTPLADFKRCRKVPCFVSHGRESTRFDVDTLCGQLKLMYAAGFDVTARQYPNGDQLSPMVLHDMNVWMMELVTGQKASPPQDSPSSVGGNNWSMN
jgi:phospholipase/carboxylesterase